MDDTTERSAAVEVRLAVDATEWRAARALVHDLAAWVRERTGLDLRTAQRGFAAEVDDLPALYRPPSGRFLLAWADGVPVGSAAIRRHADGSGELKRMYVRPGARGLELGDRLVEGALSIARRDGLRSVWLETAIGVMDPAIELYRRHGFAERTTTDASIDHPELLTMERSLLPVPAA
ncbi:MAG: GNAT family N-acetyltransferase [Actinomycetota bacterium]